MENLTCEFEKFKPNLTEQNKITHKKGKFLDLGNSPCEICLFHPPHLPKF